MNRSTILFVLGCAGLWGCTTNSVLGEPGASIFRAKCASCHGEDGQGRVDGCEDPLFGDHSVSVLARLIEQTMPEEDPDACVGDEARQVAAFIHQAFYSPAARQQKGLVARPHVELTRLTVPQYRNAVADLLGTFTPTPSQDAEVLPGLKAEYFQSKGMSKADSLKLSRIDSRVDFNFGEGSPSEDITPDQFTIIWEGALIARDTGHYEFRVRTENGARLYLNSDQTGQRRRLRDDSSTAGQAALIDAWVSSGHMRERTARVFLLGGRQYPIRLEFFKYKEQTSSIKLEWKPPHGVWSVLDHEHVVTAKMPRTYVVETSFPADDRSLGYERGRSVSREWLDATQSAAIETANEVVARLPLLAGFHDDAADRVERSKELVVSLARTAFRRPLTAKETDLLREQVFANTANLEVAVRQAVLIVLTSPHFLYTDLTPADSAPSQYTVASRLAFALWDSIPDKSLLEAADNDALQSESAIKAQAQRMLTSPRSRAKLRGFFHHWLELEERDLAKDKEMFPEFDEAVIADLRTSLEQFVADVVWSEHSDYRQLLLADFLVLNERLRALYQPPQKAEVESASTDGELATTDESVSTEQETLVSDFERVSFPPGQRAGVLTHPYLLSAFAYHNNTSPIHRGVFLTRNIVGRRLKPPPIAVAFKNDEFAPDLTMREKITQLTRDSACISCHSVINPLGFALENFDAVGRWRTVDNDKPVITSSLYVTDEGQTVEVTSALDIANFAVNSESAHRAFVTQVFHHLVKQDPAAYGSEVVEELRIGFAADDFNVQNLISRVAVLAATHGHATTTEVTSKP